MSLPSLTLLLPTVRNPRSRYHPDLSSTTSLPSPTLPTKSPKLKYSARSRITSPQPQLSSIGHAWLGNNANFEIGRDLLVLRGYQLFAVEKWSVPFLLTLFPPQYLPGLLRGRDPSLLWPSILAILVIRLVFTRPRIILSNSYPSLTDHCDRFESLVYPQIRRSQGGMGQSPP